MNTKLKTAAKNDIEKDFFKVMSNAVFLKAGNNYENLLNEIRQIVYSLYQPKETTTKVYNNIIKSMQ